MAKHAVGGPRRPGAASPCARHRRGCIGPATSTTPAASASSPTSRAVARTPSCATRSTCSSTSNTAAPPAPTPTPATAPASSCRCPTASCAASPAVRAAARRRLRRRAGVPAAPTPTAARRAARAGRAASPARKARPCSAGARCRPTSRPSAATPPRSRPVFEQVFVGRGRRARRTPTPPRASSARSTSSASASSTRCTSSTVAGRRPPRVLHRQPVGRRRSSTRACSRPRRSSAMFPDLSRPAPRVGAGPRAPALLDQHVPVVAAGPPLPLRRAQRRDQHAARQRQLDAGPRGPAAVERVRRRPRKVLPVIRPGGSDTATFDNVLEFLVMAGRSLPHAVLMMIPEPWGGNPGMDPAVRAFYEYHSSLMEPWDGPASIAFTDGTLIGAVLDRNGLRPSRYCVTTDDLRDHGLGGRRARHPAPTASCCKDRLRPGKMLLIDTAAGPHRRATTRSSAASPPSSPYGEWLRQHLVDIEAPARAPTPSGPITRPCCGASRRSATRRKTCGCCSRRWRCSGEEPIGSMGTDTALAVLSDRPRLLYDYFAQLFAQVTNPPLDAIREELVTSMGSTIGPEGNLLEADARGLPADQDRVPDPAQRPGGEAPPPAARARRSARRRCRCSTTPTRTARASSGRWRSCAARPARRWRPATAS